MAGATPLTDPGPPLGDDELRELTELALAADPDTPVADDAVSLWQAEGWDEGGLLPAWYMPAPLPGRASSPRQRWLIAVLIAAFALINAAGLCSTYGTVAFG